MTEEITVEPRTGVTPSTEPEPPKTPELPDELLQLPSIQGLMSGTPGAFSATLKSFEKDPAAKLIAKSKDALMGAGIGFYRSLSGTEGVVFNSLFVSADEIKAADAAGQLSSVAPSFDQVNADIGASGANNPVLAEVERPTGMKSSMPAPVAQVAPMPAGAQKTLASKRAQNLQIGPATSGANAGAGTLLRSIMRPVL
jgi:hypothetical protein